MISGINHLGKDEGYQSKSCSDKKRQPPVEHPQNPSKKGNYNR